MTLCNLCRLLFVVSFMIVMKSLIIGSLFIIFWLSNLGVQVSCQVHSPCKVLLFHQNSFFWIHLQRQFQLQPLVLSLPVLNPCCRPITDYYYYGKWASSAFDLLVYNVVGGHRAICMGPESHHCIRGMVSAILTSVSFLLCYLLRFSDPPQSRKLSYLEACTFLIELQLKWLHPSRGSDSNKWLLQHLVYLGRELSLAKYRSFFIHICGCR
ncbi:hypothetical protein C5167_005288 [Papaver somniferum]|uniref:Uncharacterized protein n=1 Tax=Papaver somniferum TaxID=3469 RepID=A0A4Y7JA55_PAPSO|nr:hypothetical protein C5167_005288 [Papaver somniferum]